MKLINVQRLRIILKVYLKPDILSPTVIVFYPESKK